MPYLYATLQLCSRVAALWPAAACLTQQSAAHKGMASLYRPVISKGT